MSLVQHVSSLEGVDAVPGSQDERESTNGTYNTSRSIKRKISYDFFPQSVSAIEDITTTAPYKVSTAKRLGTYPESVCHSR